MKKDVTKIIGYILLSPALFSVLMFLAQLFVKVEMFKNFMSTIWTGNLDYGYAFDGGGGGGGGSTSALPFYF